MFNLFNRKKATINSITIPSWDWIIEQDNDGLKQWMNHEGTMAMSLHFFNIPPDLPTITDLEVLRNFHRNITHKHGGGIIESTTTKLKEFDVVRTIFKIPQQQKGMTYLASLTIPFKDCSFVIKIQAPEIGITGSRDSIILDNLMRKGAVSLGENGLEGWFYDPYDPTIKEGLRMNQSEEGQYDTMFPKHPLSRARRLQRLIEKEVVFGNELKKLNTFK